MRELTLNELKNLIESELIEARYVPSKDHSMFDRLGEWPHDIVEELGILENALIDVQILMDKHVNNKNLPGYRALMQQMISLHNTIEKILSRYSIE